MKTDQTTFLIVGFAMLLFLSACDPGVRHVKTIDNFSDYDIAVIIYRDSIAGSSGYAADSFLVARHTQVDIYKNAHVGQAKKYSDCATFADSIRTIIVDHDSLHLTLDLADRSNWNYFLRNKTFKGGGTCECRILIRNEHIRQ